MEPNDLDRPIAKGVEAVGFIARDSIAIDSIAKEQLDEKKYQHFLRRRVERGWVPKTVDWLDIKPANDGVTWDWEGMRDGA